MPARMVMCLALAALPALAEPSLDPKLLRSLQERLDRAKAATAAKRYDEAVTILRALETEMLPPALSGLRASVAYEQACNLTHLNKVDAAVQALTRAVRAGYSDADHAQSDPDLELLRSTPRFPTLLTEMRAQERQLRVFDVTAWRNPDLSPPTPFDALDGPKAKALRERYALDAVIADQKSELDKQLAVLAWVHNRWAHSGLDEPTQSDALTILDEVAHGKRFRCVEYSITLAQALSALGFPARVLSLRRDGSSYGVGKGHVVTEVWNNELAKWLVLDGQNNATWELGDQPQSAIEIRNLRSQGRGAELTMKHRGSTWMTRAPDAASWLVYFHTLRFPLDNAIFEHTGRASVTLVPANHLPELLFQGTVIAEPQLDDATRPAAELNRAHADLAAVASKTGLSDTLSVRLTNSCPWPCTYVATINGHVEEVTSDHLTWPLRSGPNTLEVRTKNGLGRLGPPSTIEVTWFPPR